ncbi:MAG: ParB/RepB/Spo0J family partition protein [Gammaproteobacteria bacterium]
MASKKRGLGRGLDALLGGSNLNPVPVAETAAQAVTAAGKDSIHSLPVDVIHRGRYQPRQDFNPEALQELADSISAQGVVQPVVVRPHPDKAGQYELIAGERRWRATQLAGLHDVPVVIRDVSDQTAMAMGLIENIQREELNPMEQAFALQRLIDEFALTHQEAAEAVGRSRAAVSNLLRLLALQDEAKKLLERGEIEMGHARAILALEGGEQIQAARQVAKKGLSVRETEALVRKLLKPKQPPASGRIDPDTQRLQDELSEKLGARVEFQHGAKGKGKLLIHYNNLDELEGILGHIK